MPFWPLGALHPGSLWKPAFQGKGAQYLKCCHAFQVGKTLFGVANCDCSTYCFPLPFGSLRRVQNGKEACSAPSGVACMLLGQLGCYPLGYQ